MRETKNSERQQLLKAGKGNRFLCEPWKIELSRVEHLDTSPVTLWATSIELQSVPCRFELQFVSCAKLIVMGLTAPPLPTPIHSSAEVARIALVYPGQPLPTVYP